MWKRLSGQHHARQARLPDSLQERFDVSQAVRLESRDELDKLRPRVQCSLSAEFNVEALAGRLCPVLMSDRTVALFSLAEHVGSDQADELLRRVVLKGYRLAKPSRFVLDAPLLLAVARNQMNGFSSPDGSNATGLRHSRTALAAAFQDLIEWGVRHGASDLHLNVHADSGESEVKYTIKGRYLAPERFRNMPTQMLTDMLSVVWMDIHGGNGAVFDPRTEQQGSLVRKVDGTDVLIRWASLAADAGPSVCLRLLIQDIDPASSDLGSLGYLPQQVADIERVMISDGGAIVFAGTVGSGKSTTLASLISRIPSHRKIITIEDPVEYRIANAIQNTVARALSDAQPRAYMAKLRTLKRSAMSDVLLGEIRDHESGQAFLDLAGSGVNVYTTVHAPSAAIVPDRLASDFIGVSRDFLLTPGVLRLIVYQALIMRLCPHCSRPVSELSTGDYASDGRYRSGREWAKWLERIQETYQIDTSTMRIRNRSGCDRCGAIARERNPLPSVTRSDSPESGSRVQAIPACDTGVLNGYGGRMVAAELIEPSLQPCYLDSVRSDCVGQWLQEQTARLARQGLHAPAIWRNAMDNSVLQALQGHIDPRDVERHFLAFETRFHQVRMAGQVPGAVS